MTIVLWIAAVLLVLIGIAGTVVPVLPGAPLVFGGLLVAAYNDGFVHVGWITLTLLGILTLASLAVDLVATSLGAKRAGASYRAIVGATIGTFVGLFFGIAGLVVGPFAGAVIGEYSSRRNWTQAGRAGFGTWIGLVVGTAAKLGLVFVMIGVFVLGFVL
jgi:uncharacterized protein